jgi:hypothetical protein
MLRKVDSESRHIDGSSIVIALLPNVFIRTPNMKSERICFNAVRNMLLFRMWALLAFGVWCGITYASFCTMPVFGVLM